MSSKQTKKEKGAALVKDDLQITHHHRLAINYINQQEKKYGVNLPRAFKYNTMSAWTSSQIDDYFNELLEEHYED